MKQTSFSQPPKRNFFCYYPTTYILSHATPTAKSELTFGTGPPEAWVLSLPQASVNFMLCACRHCLSAASRSLSTFFLLYPCQQPTRGRQGCQKVHAKIQLEDMSIFCRILSRPCIYIFLNSRIIIMNFLRIPI